ncbi:hypothetical protein [Thermococcus sp.]
MVSVVENVTENPSFSHQREALRELLAEGEFLMMVNFKAKLEVHEG